MEALEAAIGHWQDAQAALQVGDALPSAMDVELTRRLESLIDEAYKLQDACERLFLHQVTNFSLHTHRRISNFRNTEGQFRNTEDILETAGNRHPSSSGLLEPEQI